MKKVSVIGATGFVGSKVVKELSDRGYEVQAIARDSSAVPPLPNVHPVNADVNDVDALSAILKGSDAVISAFNAGWTNPDLYRDFISGCENIEKATEESGVKRLIVIGGAGSLYIDGKQLVDGSDFPAAFKPGAGAARDYLNILRGNKTLDWTFFSPAIEMNHETSRVRTGKYRTGLENPVFDASGRSIISAEDVAVALVDELEQNQHIRQRFTAAY